MQEGGRKSGEGEQREPEAGGRQTVKVRVPKSLQFLSMTGLRIKTFPVGSDNLFVVTPPLPIGARATHVISLLNYQ